MQALGRLSSSSKRVTIGTFKEALKTNLVGRGKSYAASVKDETVKLRKIPKRIPKQERRALIVSFIEEYRASNEGRFPTSTVVQKEFGGSYYTVREIIQELKYKLAQVDPPGPIDLKESRSGVSSDSIGEKVAPTVAVSKKVSVKRDQSSMIFEAEGIKKEELSGKAIDISVEDQIHDMASTKVEVPNETSSYAATNMVKVVKEAREVETRSQTVQNSVNTENFRVPDEVPIPEESQGKETSNEHDHYNKEGSIWGNLKSFSDKIVNFWKKL
ncbi:hydroxyproline-rich glycoprotein family protein [Rhynchospora pubera]|uniref:Hydroxyproline-rich glycoprotein family protein n=1 Tax=Rhynchospora pubera TaxID=906938 RepID=A0AAV8BUX2_9POAL|nr:hydroxyproline-rich glycoprotein family protein [Rhynchospora pubera]